MTWFLKLPAEIQVALVLQACGLIFGCGVWWATIRSLSKAVVELKIEVKKRLGDHDAKLEEHSEELTRLRTLQEAARSRHGGGR